MWAPTTWKAWSTVPCLPPCIAPGKKLPISGPLTPWHCLAARAGKVGAIVAGVVLAQVSNQAKFYISAICGLVGFIMTIIWVPGACCWAAHLPCLLLLQCMGTSLVCIPAIGHAGCVPMSKISNGDACISC